MMNNMLGFAVVGGSASPADAWGKGESASKAILAVSHCVDGVFICLCLRAHDHNISNIDTLRL